MTGTDSSDMEISPDRYSRQNTFLETFLTVRSIIRQARNGRDTNER
jgi:hypothetical protein